MKNSYSLRKKKVFLQSLICFIMFMSRGGSDGGGCCGRRRDVDGGVDKCRLTASGLSVTNSF